MFDAVIAIIFIALVAIATGAICVLSARRIVIIERWIITLPIRIFKRGWSPKPISRLDISTERVVGILFITLGIYMFIQFPVQFGELSKVAPPDGGEMSAIMAKHAKPLIMNGKAVGVAIGVIQGDRSAVAGFGRMGIGDRRTPNENTIFEIGSVTKVFTVCALSAMVKRGEVKLDDRIDSLLPKSFKTPAYNGRQISLLDLATHTSGLPRVADNSTDWLDVVSLSCLRNPYASYNDLKLRKFLADCKLASRPGEKCEYSNLGMGLLGYALCQKQHRSYGKMIDDEICQPLALKDTSIVLSKDQTKRLAQGYYGSFVDGTSILAFPASSWNFNDTNAGAGALRSTVKDLMKFVRANLGDSPKGLGPILEATHKVRFKIDDRMSVCLAWHTLSTPKHKEPIIWHNGGTGGYVSFIGFCKKHHTGVVLLCNVSPSDESTDKAAIRILYDACKRSGH